MADFGGSQSESFGLGVDHQANQSGHQNNYMLGNDARDDQGLTDDSERWNDLTPQGVTQAAETPRLPRADVHDPAPEYTAHPAHLTARQRTALLTEPAHLLRAKALQLDYHQRAAEAEPQARNG